MKPSLKKLIQSTSKEEFPAVRDVISFDGKPIGKLSRDFAVKFVQIDFEREELICYCIGDYSSIESIHQHEDSLIALVKEGSSFFLLRKTMGEKVWTSEAFSQKINTSAGVHLLHDKQGMLILNDGKLFSRAVDGAWQVIEFEDILSPHFIFPQAYTSPKMCLISSNSLYLGYDFGEWGGGAFKIPISWKGDILSLGKISDLPGRNIVGMALAKDGSLWIAEGNNHLGMKSAGLYHVKGEVSERILWFRSPDKLSLEGKSEIAAFCLSPEGEPVIAASELGIYAIADQQLIPLYAGNIWTNLETEMALFINTANGLTYDEKGRLFTGMGSGGIFQFAKREDRWEKKLFPFPVLQGKFVPSQDFDFESDEDWLEEQEIYKDEEE